MEGTSPPDSLVCPESKRRPVKHRLNSNLQSPAEDLPISCPPGTGHLSSEVRAWLDTSRDQAENPSDRQAHQKIPRRNTEKSLHHI